MSITLGGDGVIGAGGERERPGGQQRGPEAVRDPVPEVHQHPSPVSTCREAAGEVGRVERTESENKSAKERGKVQTAYESPPWDRIAESPV